MKIFDFLRKRWYHCLAFLIILVLLFSAYFFGFYRAEKQMESLLGTGSEGIFSEQNQASSISNLDFKMFWQVWNLLKQQYVNRQDLNDKDLYYGAIKGVVQATGDPYSAFLDPETYGEFQIELAGKFEGIGAEIGMRDEIITVVAPLEGMPAEKAGLRAGDQVIKIDEELTFGLSVMEAVRKIRGPRGSQVVLTIAREGEMSALDISIIRDVIVLKSVKTELRKDNIFVIRVTDFGDDTDSLFNQAVNEVLLKNPKGIILDLRNNPGGYLYSAVLMAGDWIKKNDLVVQEDFGNGKKQEHLSEGNARLANIPTVVLVNQGSASASEIVSGALQDQGKAVVIGQQTFGKGTVQSLTELSDGSAVKITTAKWLTPKGRDISKEGIEPDIIVDYTFEDYNNKKDPQLDKALETLLK